MLGKSLQQICMEGMRKRKMAYSILLLQELYMLCNGLATLKHAHPKRLLYTTKVWRRGAVMRKANLQNPRLLGNSQ